MCKLNPAARASQEARITQPSLRLLFHVCISPLAPLLEKNSHSLTVVRINCLLTCRWKLSYINMVTDSLGAKGFKGHFRFVSFEGLSGSITNIWPSCPKDTFPLLFLDAYCNPSISRFLNDVEESMFLGAIDCFRLWTGPEPESCLVSTLPLPIPSSNTASHMCISCFLM